MATCACIHFVVILSFFLFLISEKKKREKLAILAESNTRVDDFETPNF